MALLEIENIHSYYGNIHALQGVSLTVEEGEVVTLIGSNGAGKTTTLRSIHGILPPREGKIVFDGEEIQGMPAHDMIPKGIAQSPEGRKIFHRMTVMENLEMGAYHRNDRDGDPARTWTASSTSSRASRSASSRSPARCPAASSRCSPSDAP